jgi:hypothetical protein
VPVRELPADSVQTQDRALCFLRGTAIKQARVPGTLKLRNKQNAHSSQALAPDVEAQEAIMKRIFIAAAALAISGAAVMTPANAQGVGVQVGPVGVGVGAGPYWDDGYHHRYWHGDSYGYASGCRVIRERVETPNGRMIVKTRRICD